MPLATLGKEGKGNCMKIDKKGNRFKSQQLEKELKTGDNKQLKRIKLK